MSQLVNESVNEPVSMKAFRQLEGIVAPMPIDNVDTDQIIPSREMKRVSKTGLGQGLFAGWRYTYDGGKKTGDNPDFVLNRPEYRAADILLSGKNFGCGSSREHAVWALKDYGFRVLIAESFGRIFRNNCARNGLLAIALPAETIAALEAQTRIDPEARRVLVDLEANVLRGPDGSTFAFAIAESDRHMLLNGLDYIDFTLRFEADIDRFVEADRLARPWAHR